MKNIPELDKLFDIEPQPIAENLPAISPETGKNIDGAIIEKGTADTKEKMQVNVPPPTVINQGGKGGEAPPQITFPGGVANVRSNDPTWLRFQDKRATS